MSKTKFSINVLSYNIHKGFNAGSRRFVLSEIRSAIRAVSADVVFLQEVLGHDTDPKSKIKNWPNGAQFEFLADEIWNHHAYGKNATFTNRHHGNAILSKYPIISWDNIDVSTNNLEKRGILHGVIHIPELDKRVHVLCVHFDLTEKGRIQQIRKLAERVAKHIPEDEPLLLGGDFNDWRQKASPILKTELGLREAFIDLHGRHARTFPVFLPTLCLDRIYFRGFKARATQRLVDKHWRKLSDHVAIGATLELK